MSYIKFDWLDIPETPNVPTAVTNATRPSGSYMDPTNLEQQNADQCWKYADEAAVAPNGETWNIEINNPAVTPRFPNTGVCRFWTDFQPPFVQDPTQADPYSKTDRAELHIHREVLQIGTAGGCQSPELRPYEDGGKTGMSEGETLWLGVSDKWLSLDESRTSTVLQFYTRPKADILDTWGINEAPYNDTANTSGGPACQILHVQVAGKQRYAVELRSGAGDSYTARTVIIPFDIVLDRWYDIVCQYTWSPTAGRFRIWIYDSTTDSNYSVTDTPDIDDTGNTDYTYPIPPAPLASIATMNIRLGCYRYNCIQSPTLTSADYHMERHIGPLRMFRQAVADDVGFYRVVPRSNEDIVFALNPAVPGFTVQENAPDAGVITYNGTVAAGVLWLAVDATDDNGTTTSPKIAVTIAANQLLLSNPRATSITQTTATLTIDALTATGDIYAAIRDSGPYTAAADVKSGVGADWGQDKPAALSTQFYPAGLVADQLYYFGLVQSDGGDDSNLITGTFTTQSNISYTETGKAPTVRPY